MLRIFCCFAWIVCAISASPLSADEISPLPGVDKFNSIHLTIYDALTKTEVRINYGKPSMRSSATVELAHETNGPAAMEAKVTQKQIEQIHSKVQEVVAKFKFRDSQETLHSDVGWNGGTFSVSLSAVGPSLELGYDVADKENIRPAAELFAMLLKLIPKSGIEKIDWLPLVGVPTK
jgi:hypothetical protein